MISTIFAQAAAATAAEWERFRLSLEARHAIALRAERIAEVTGLPTLEVARLLERLDPYAPTEDQVVAVLKVWRSTGVDPVATLGSLYLSCPLPRDAAES